MTNPAQSTAGDGDKPASMVPYTEHDADISSSPSRRGTPTFSEQSGRAGSMHPPTTLVEPSTLPISLPVEPLALSPPEPDTTTPDATLPDATTDRNFDALPGSALTPQEPEHLHRDDADVGREEPMPGLALADSGEHGLEGGRVCEDDENNGAPGPSGEGASGEDESSGAPGPSGEGASDDDESDDDEAGDDEAGDDKSGDDEDDGRKKPRTKADREAKQGLPSGPKGRWTADQKAFLSKLTTDYARINKNGRGKNKRLDTFWHQVQAEFWRRWKWEELQPFAKKTTQKAVMNNVNEVSDITQRLRGTTHLSSRQ